MLVRPVDVVFVVDQKWRDLPGMAALAALLEGRHGLSSALIPYARWRESLALHRPKLITVTHMNGTRNRAIADCAKAQGTLVGVIQAEGRPNNEDTMEYAVGKGADTRGVDVWFTWSDTVRDFMLERGLLPPGRVVTAGVSRFDFYRPPFASLVQSREQMCRRYGLDPTRPVVTLATNFTCTKYFDRNRQFLVDDWKNLGLSQFKAYADPEDFAARDVEAREKTLAVMRALLKRHPRVQLAIKPHPTEEHGRYREFVDEMRALAGASVAFIGLDYIFNVLSMSNVHLHRLCTTGVEAWFMNVPSIDMHLVDYHGWSVKIRGAAAEAIAGNDFVQDEASCLARVEHFLEGGTHTPAQLAARDAYTRKWLHVVDGRRSERHADVIASLVSGTPRPAPPLTERGRAIARRVAVRVTGDVWSGAARRSKTDELGQVDARISDSDAHTWIAAAKGILA